ncbi:MAG: TerC/Alx family metal homeostasis membrane protein [Candidatus Adiutrix sp.]|jgi:tellurite resistance protein TerC|nr:TerC/Alx family metal homeostasis membrane protein [Candidatus Adiutrix sp.]
MEYSWAEIAVFAVIVTAAFWVDLRAHREHQAVSLKNAALWSGVWVALGLGFAGWVGLRHGLDDSLLYLTGYVLEKSLSVDNLFVFLAIFSSFGVRDEYQHRVLHYGILGAIILRLLFVAVGTSLLAWFGPWALTAFGLFVLWSAFKLWQESRKPKEEIVDYSGHWSVRAVRRWLPVSDSLDGSRFFTRQNGRLMVTPLFLCLVTVEVADVMFAFDSVPAVIAVTEKPFLIYTSNIFAILGLRSLYFVLAAAARLLAHLGKAIIAVLGFIGLKMLTQAAFGFHLPPLVSLSVVLPLLAAGVAGSLVFPAETGDTGG